jgi:hypothetical protein
MEGAAPDSVARMNNDFLLKSNQREKRGLRWNEYTPGFSTGAGDLNQNLHFA